jgi:hypothetical protein
MTTMISQPTRGPKGQSDVGGASQGPAEGASATWTSGASQPKITTIQAKRVSDMTASLAHRRPASKRDGGAEFRA